MFHLCRTILRATLLAGGFGLTLPQLCEPLPHREESWRQEPSLPPRPAAPPAEWKLLIGDYDQEPERNHFLVLEQNGELFLTGQGGRTFKLARTAPGTYTPLPFQPDLQLLLDSSGKALLRVGPVSIRRHDYVAENGSSFKIHPLRPVEELRAAALKQAPPSEAGTFRKPELVELASLDPAIHLEIRYALSNNFLGTPVYSQARAFLQRPAAQALLRALGRVKLSGFGLLIHDAYRPWYVTKIFWEATPPEGKIFVADPSEGSRHNRGCAVDLTLYDLATNRPVEMPGTYDEMSPRSFSSYPGGSSLERWHREVLRSALEAEGFAVYDAEWWHFDYQDWKQYPLLNLPFEQLGAEQGSTLAH